MLEIMRKSQQGNPQKDANQNITFDYDGKIIQIQKPNETTFPDTLTNPKIKMKQAVVLSNYIKEQMDRQFSLKESKSKSKTKSKIDQMSLQSAETLNKKMELLETKKNVKILDVFKPVSNMNNINIKPNPMGSNFKEFNPQPGIVMVENGKIKQNQTALNRDETKLTVEEYQQLKEGASIS